MYRALLAVVILITLSIPAGADMDAARNLLDQGEDAAAVEELRKVIWKNRASRADAAEEDGADDGRARGREMTEVRTAAQILLGDLFLEGRGVTRNYSLAWDWYWRAFADGNAEAAFKLGQLIEAGRGVPRYVPKAIEWYEKAAGKGHVPSMTRMAEIHRNGIDDILPNPILAAEWEAKADDTRRKAADAAVEKARRDAEEKARRDAEEKREAEAVDLASMTGKVLSRIAGQGAEQVERAIQARQRGYLKIDQEPALAALAGAYVAISNAGDVEGMKQLLHPQSLACVGKGGAEAFERFLRDDYLRAIPEDHSLVAKEIAADAPLPFEDMVDYPVRPTHWVKYQFVPEPGRRVSVVRTLADEAGTWSMVVPCFDAASIQRKADHSEGMYSSAVNFFNSIVGSNP
jgi:hypothetical protein